MAGVTYDTGVLIAAERGDRRTWNRHRGLLVQGVIPTVPAPVLAQAWRGGPRQAMLPRFLAGCHVEPLLEGQAKVVGALLGVARHEDVADGCVVEGAARRGDLIVTADRADIERLVAAVGRPLDVEDA